MQQTVVPGISMWSVWQPDRNLYFNSFFVATPNGNLVVDPLPLGDADATEIERLGGIAWIVITNRDHERGARELAGRFGAKLAASGGDAELLSGAVDRRLDGGDEIMGARVIALAGLKTPGEIALHFAASGTLVFGDAMWGSPAGALRLMPDEKLADPVRATLSLRHVAALQPQHVLVGDGACVFGNGTRVLRDALEARGLPQLTRINRDEAVWRTWSGGPAKYDGKSFEVGDIIGAEKLGYRITLLPPHSESCPLHWHGAEEELFVVLSGAATLLTPAGETAVRAGDYIAFPTRPQFAHKIRNAHAEPCEILMVANTDARDVCYYPDSQKLLIEATDLILRDRPALTYFDGE